MTYREKVTEAPAATERTPMLTPTRTFNLVRFVVLPTLILAVALLAGAPLQLACATSLGFITIMVLVWFIATAEDRSEERRHARMRASR